MHSVDGSAVARPIGADIPRPLPITVTSIASSIESLSNITPATKARSMTYKVCTSSYRVFSRWTHGLGNNADMLDYYISFLSYIGRRQERTREFHAYVESLPVRPTTSLIHCLSSFADPNRCP